jgi:peptide/nickel transport system substrate-binding protein
MIVDREQITRRAFLGTGAALAVGALDLPQVLDADVASGAERSRTLVYANSDTPPSFDLDQTGIDLTEQIASACYGGDIVRYKIVNDAKAHVELADIFAPGRSGIDTGLAESIDVSADLRTFTFHLRPDARSAEGNRLTAEDVIWSFQRSAALGQTGAFFTNVMEVTGHSIKARDAHTVRFTLPQPNPIFLRVDAMKYVDPAG